MAHDEDGKVRVAGFHQVDVLQGVSDENLEILDVHPLSFALTVADCRSETEILTVDTVHLELVNMYCLCSPEVNKETFIASGPLHLPDL